MYFTDQNIQKIGNFRENIQKITQEFFAFPKMSGLRLFNMESKQPEKMEILFKETKGLGL